MLRMITVLVLTMVQEILKCPYVTGESARDRTTSHCYCHTQTAWRPPADPYKSAPAVSCHCRAGSFTQQSIMTSETIALKRHVYASSLFFAVKSLSLRSVAAGCPARFWHDSCPTVWGLSAPTWGKQGGDYLKKIERESVDLCNVERTVL